MRSLSGAPRASDGPWSTRMSPISSTSPSGMSLVHVTSTAIATSGPHRKRGRARAREVADFLTDRRDRDDVARRAACLGDAPRGLERDVAADTVVPRARGEPVVAQLDRLRREHGAVAEPHDRARLFSVARADVDEEILHLDLLVLVPLERAALLADHAGDAAVARRAPRRAARAAPRAASRRCRGTRGSPCRRCA